MSRCSRREAAAAAGVGAGGGKKELPRWADGEILELLGCLPLLPPPPPRSPSSPCSEVDILALPLQQQFQGIKSRAVGVGNVTTKFIFPAPIAASPGTLPAPSDEPPSTAAYARFWLLCMSLTPCAVLLAHFSSPSSPSPYPRTVNTQVVEI